MTVDWDALRTATRIPCAPVRSQGYLERGSVDDGLPDLARRSLVRDGRRLHPWRLHRQDGRGRGVVHPHASWAPVEVAGRTYRPMLCRSGMGRFWTVCRRFCRSRALMTRCSCGTEPCSWTVPQPYGRLLTALWALLLKRTGARKEARLALADLKARAADPS